MNRHYESITGSLAALILLITLLIGCFYDPGEDIETPDFIYTQNEDYIS